MGQSCSPDIVIYRLHHSGFGLADGHLEALCLAVAGQSCRSVAYGTVRVHPDDGLPLLKIIVSGIHGLVCVRGSAVGSWFRDHAAGTT